jgi:AcrR family transcriptional regulator|tara:strand:+ start:772 stop:1452 length:681 start_codon:yes stop_codon:yes gene_type:complete
MAATKSRKKKDPAVEIETAALRLAAQRSWDDLSLRDIAEEAKLPLSEVFPHYRSKVAILRGFTDRIDLEVLSQAAAEKAAPDAPREGPRDRLFNVLMLRFESLQPYRLALAGIAQSQLRHPMIGLATSCQLSRSLDWMLEAAEIDCRGFGGLLRRKGIMAAYLASLRVFLRDDSDDLAKTMAALDSYLRRGEKALSCCDGWRHRRDRRRAEADDAAPVGGAEATPA